MIWIFLFVGFFIFSLKEFYFFNYCLAVDPWTIMMLSVLPLVFLLVSSFSMNHLGSQESLHYYLLGCLSVLAVGTSFCVDDPLYFLILLEITVPLMMLSILMFSKDSDKLDSVIFMLYLNLMGSSPFLLFCLHSSGVAVKISSFEFSFSSVVSLGLFFCFLLVLMVKLPIFFFHNWLTKAHVSASGVFSMILASLMLKLGGFGLLKFSSYFFSVSLSYMDHLLSFSLMGYLIFVFLMLRYCDNKYFIACSSILHMSFIFPMLIFCSSSSLYASSLMMVGHGLVSYVLFYLVTILYESTLHRSSHMNSSLESISKTLSLFFFFFLLMNMGVPPLVNFVSELFFCFSIFTYSLTAGGFLFVVFVPVIFLFMYYASSLIFGKKNLFSKIENFISVSEYISFFFVFLVLILFLS